MSSGRIGYPGQRTPAALHISQNYFPSVVLSLSPAVLNSLATPAITPSHAELTTPELESGGGERPSSRSTMATGLECSILAKACPLMWEWTIFVNLFPPELPCLRKSGGAVTMPRGNWAFPTLPMPPHTEMTSQITLIL